MIDSNPASARVLELADEFLDRYRRGERPSLGEYAARFPDLAAEIREVFPAMAVMERIALADESIEGRRLPSVPPARQAFRQLGDFRILREVGRGGMGLVFEAEQVSLGRHVALKVLPESVLRDSKQRSRFEREAKAAARLHHTNIVPVFGVGEDDGTPYYAMQFIAGLGIDQVIKELKRQRGHAGPGEETPAAAGSPRDPTITRVARSLLDGQLAVEGLTEAIVEDGAGLGNDASPPGPVAARSGDPTPLSSPSRSILGLSTGDGSRLDGTPRPSYWRGVARIGSQVADALAYAHSQGIFHRDIKPSNLLLDPRGVVWVTDFGLAKVEDQEALTNTGDVVGTLRYMPPEAFEGRHDARGDVYSLGLSLYEMLAFRPAFDESDRGRLIRQVTAGEPPRLRTINPEVPRDLETVVHKAIEREPSHRYATAAIFAEDLRRYMEDRPILARRASETEKLRRWCRRNKVLAGLLATLFLVFWAGFGLVAWEWRTAVAEREAKDNERLRAVASEKNASLARDRADAERQKALLAADRAERSLYYGRIARARLEYQANNIAQSEASLDLCDPARRGWEWRFLKGLIRSELFRLEGHDGWVHQVAISPDGRLIATAGGGNSFFRRAQPGSIRPGRVILWDAATGRKLREFGGAAHLVTNVAFSPDGRTLASAGLDGKARIFDLADGRLILAVGDDGVPEAVSDRHPFSVPLAFSPDGRRLAIGRSDRSMTLVDAATDAIVARLPISRYGYREATFSPDGRWLATSTADDFQFANVAQVWDAATGAEAVSLETGSKGHSRVCFSPDSRRLAGVEYRSGMIKIWGLPGGKIQQVLPGHDRFTLALAFSPDGLRFASAGRDGKVRITNLRSGHAEREIRGHTEAITSLAFSPDGVRLISGAQDGLAMVWDLTRDPEVADIDSRPTVATTAIEAIAYDRTGGRFVSINRSGVIDRFESGTNRVFAASETGQATEWLSPGGLVRFDAEGRHVLVASRADRREAVRVDTTADAARTLLRGHVLPIRWVRLGPDGSRAATAGGADAGGPDGLRGEAIVWDAERGRPLHRWTSRTEQPVGIALDGAGRHLAISAVRVEAGPDGARNEISSLAVIEVATGREVLRQDPLAATCLAVGFSPDGRRLAAACYDRTLSFWDMSRLRLAATSGQGAEGAMDLAFSPDGRRIAIASRRLVEIVDAETGEEVLILRGRGQTYLNTHGFNPSVRFSPDGARILAVCDDMFPFLSEWSADDGDAGGPEARVRSAEMRKAPFLLETWSGLLQDDRASFLPFFMRQFEGMTLDSNQNTRLASVLIEAGRLDLSEVAFSRAAAQSAGSDRVALWAGTLYSNRNAWGLAGAWFARVDDRRLREHFGRNAGAWIYHAADRILAGDLDGYRRVCKEFVAVFGETDSPDEADMLARTCVFGPDALGDAARAIRLAERALKLAEDGRRNDLIPQCLDGLGRAYELSGDIGRAESCYRKSLGLRPPLRWQACCGARLAVVLLRQGRRPEAMGYLHGAIQWAFPGSKADEAAGLLAGRRPPEIWIDTWCEVYRAGREAMAMILDDGFPADPFAR